MLNFVSKTKWKNNLYIATACAVTYMIFYGSLLGSLIDFTVVFLLLSLFDWLISRHGR